MTVQRECRAIAGGGCHVPLLAADMNYFSAENGRSRTKSRKPAG